MRGVEIGGLTYLPALPLSWPSSLSAGNSGLTRPSASRGRARSSRLLAHQIGSFWANELCVYNSWTCRPSPKIEIEHGVSFVLHTFVLSVALHILFREVISRLERRGDLVDITRHLMPGNWYLEPFPARPKQNTHMQPSSEPPHLSNTPKRLACYDRLNCDIFLNTLRQPWDLPRRVLPALAWGPWERDLPLAAVQWLGDLPRSQRASPTSPPKEH